MHMQIKAIKVECTLNNVHKKCTFVQNQNFGS